MRIHIYLIILLSFLTSCKKSNDKIFADVCIYGNSSASVIAAIQLKKSGRSVVVVSPDKYVGGMTIEGLGSSDINNHRDFKNDVAIGGLTLEFYKKVADYYGITDFESERIKTETWKFEPHVAEKILLNWLEEYKIPVYYSCRLIQNFEAVKKINSKIENFKTENNKIFTAGIFIDCSYEGDLLYFSGVSTIAGRESNHLYNETKNGIRTTNEYRNFTVAVDPYIIPGNSDSGIIHTIQNEEMGNEGDGDSRIQAYCFRACLTDDPINRVAFTKPKNYNRSWYEIYIRFLNAGGKLYSPRSNLPNQKTDLGAWHDLSHNLYGMNHGYPSGTYEQRDSIYNYHLDFTQGLFFFLSNDLSVPDSVRNIWNKWGTTKDEFTDNNGWPRMVYIRDGRRMISEIVITEHNTRKDTVINIEDPVAIAYWPPDVHHVRRIIKDGKAYNEGFVFGGDNWKPFQIPYRSLVPKRIECTNIMTPTCPSSSHIAFGAIRLEWTFMVLGQSLGIAANLCLKNNIAVQDLPYDLLKAELIKNNQIIQMMP